MDALNRLRTHIDQIPTHLGSLSDTQLMYRMPGKWSRKEILGHLIDSAINNLKRFTDAQFADGSYVVQPYNQNELVRVNQYQNVPMNHLLELWQSLNRQIVYVVETIPEDGLAQTIQLGQFHAEHKTLGWLINDYVDHLEHHLASML